MLTSCLQEQFANGALCHFYFRSEDGSTYNSVPTTASVDKNGTILQQMQLYTRGEKKGGKEKRKLKRMENREKKCGGCTLSKSHFQHVKNELWLSVPFHKSAIL
jgi:hypothetical protein